MKADIMTGWCPGYCGRRLTVKILTHKLMEHDVVPPPMAEDFKYPATDIIRNPQLRNEENALRNMSKKEKQLWTETGKVWIPEQDNDLQIKILADGPCGSKGYRGRDVTLSILRESYNWKIMQDDTSDLVAAC